MRVQCQIISAGDGHEYKKRRDLHNVAVSLPLIGATRQAEVLVGLPKGALKFQIPILALFQLDPRFMPLGINSHHQNPSAQESVSETKEIDKFCPYQTQTLKRNPTS